MPRPRIIETMANTTPPDARPVEARADAAEAISPHDMVRPRQARPVSGWRWLGGIAAVNAIVVGATVAAIATTPQTGSASARGAPDRIVANIDDDGGIAQALPVDVGQVIAGSPSTDAALALALGRE